MGQGFATRNRRLNRPFRCCSEAGGDRDRCDRRRPGDRGDARAPETSGGRSEPVLTSLPDRPDGARAVAPRPAVDAWSRGWRAWAQEAGGAQAPSGLRGRRDGTPGRERRAEESERRAEDERSQHGGAPGANRKLTLNLSLCVGGSAVLVVTEVRRWGQSARRARRCRVRGHRGEPLGDQSARRARRRRARVTEVRRWAFPGSVSAVVSRELWSASTMNPGFWPG